MNTKRRAAWLVWGTICVVVAGWLGACRSYQPVRSQVKLQANPWSLGQTRYLRWVYPPASGTGVVSRKAPMGRIVSAPVLGRNAVYLTTLDGKLHAISFQGQRLWTFQDPSNPDDLIVSSPTVTPEGNIFFGTKNLFLYSISPSGTSRWKDLVQGSITTTPMNLEQSIYVPISSRGMLQVFSQSGRRQWKYVLEGGDEQRLMTPVPTLDGTIYLASQDGYIHALSSKSKQLLWKQKFCQKIAAPPVLGVYGQLFVSCWTKTTTDSASWKGLLLHIRVPDRKIVWRFTTQAPILSRPVLSPDEKTVYVGSDDTYFYAIQANTGKIQWRFQSGKYKKVGNRWLTQPEKHTAAYFQARACLDPGGQIYVGSVNHFLYALSPQGKLLWQKDLGGWIIHAPVLRKDPTNGQRTLFVAAGRRLFAFHPPK